VIWALVTGEKGAPRTAAVRDAVARLAALGVRAAGVVAERAPGGRHGLARLATGEVLPIARPPGGPERAGEDAHCELVFDRARFATARAWLAEDGAGADLLVFGGVSGLEATGRGHHDALRDAIAAGRPLLLAVRSEELFRVMERLGFEDEPAATLDAAEGEAARAAFAAAIARALGRAGQAG
jgi:hypothetical protein